MSFILMASAEIGKLSVFPGEGETFFYNLFIFDGTKMFFREYNAAIDATCYKYGKIRLRATYTQLRDLFLLSRHQHDIMLLQ